MRVVFLDTVGLIALWERTSAMLLRIKKLDSAVVTSCLRDGRDPEIQRTGHGGFSALHDLLHYAVETTLGLREGFLGLMASGWSFDHFTRHDDPNYRPLPAEASVAEHVVGILTLHRNDAAAVDDADLLGLLTDEINRDVASATSGAGIAAPVLSPSEICAIFRTYRALASRWADVPLGEHIELSF